jgi:hypothetical protein
MASFAVVGLQANCQLMIGSDWGKALFIPTMHMVVFRNAFG